MIKALVLRTAGTNCDQESVYALKLAGAEPVVAHINALLQKKVTLDDIDLLIIPGGFSYGDDIAAGKILANELRYKLDSVIRPFIARGRRIIGICNGFQVLVKTGYLPGAVQDQTVTLSANDSGRFQCHWVKLRREKSAAKWLNSTEVSWDLPIAHGEGKFIPMDDKVLADLEKKGQVVFRYEGENPNGSVNRIAGICNAEGTIVGLMPHPERHVLKTQHPEWTRTGHEGTDPVGLQFFKSAVEGLKK